MDQLPHGRQPKFRNNPAAFGKNGQLLDLGDKFPDEPHTDLRNPLLDIPSADCLKIDECRFCELNGFPG